MATLNLPEVDPIIRWPGEDDDELRTIIADLQRLNPAWNLRCAVERHEPKRNSALLVMGESGPQVEKIAIPPGFEPEPYEVEFLVYDGTALDVVPITMPELPTDEMMSGFTEINREWGPEDTDLGLLRTGPRRIERTSGGLLIRPRSEHVESAAAQFAWKKDRKRPREQIGRIQSRWGIFRDPYELWEVDFAYLPPNLLDGPESTLISDHEYWRSIPIGTISYIDPYDLPIEEHYERAREIVKAGSEFAIVGDLLAGDLRIFRESGAQRVTKDVRIPEMPWLEIPVVQSDLPLQSSLTQPRKPKRSI